MAHNETETRDERAVSPVSNAAPVNHEDPISRNQLPTSAPQQSQPQQPNALYQQNAPYQQPYGGYPYPPQPYQYGQPIRALPAYSKTWVMSKLIITIASTISSIIILALASALLAEQENEGISYYALPISIAMILWNGAELITLGVRWRRGIKRGIHPGAHVGLHLCLWIVCVFGILLSVFMVLSVESAVMECADDDDNTSSYSRRYCSMYRYGNTSYMNGTYLPLIRAVTAFFCLSGLSHFVLFVLACVETHKRNLMRPAGVVMPPAPPPGAMYFPPTIQNGAAPYYPYPMPMAPQQAYGVPPTNAPGAGTGNNTGQNPTSQNYQNYAGFYAPEPAHGVHSTPMAAPGPSNEKAVASGSGSAPAGQAV